MGLKDFLISIKNELANQNNNLKDIKFYRLRYIKFHNSDYFYKSKEFDVIDIPFELFLMPNNMSQTDGLKILSYSIDLIEKNNNINKRNIDSVELLNNIIKQKNSIFKTTNKNIEENNIIDLFVIIGKMEHLKNSKYNFNYFEWYIPNVTESEIDKISNKYNIDLNMTIKESEKQLIKKK